MPVSYGTCLQRTTIGLTHIHNLLTKYLSNQILFKDIDKCYYATQLNIFRTNFSFFVN